MRHNPISVCLVSPLPPPYGGIGHWTSMISKYASGRKDAELVVVNTAPRWRSIHSNGLLLRSIGGGIQLIRDVGRLIKAFLFRRFDVVHLTTSGHLAAIRDLFVSYVAWIFGVPLVYHIRFGRIPAIASSGTLEWRLIHRVMRRAAAVITIDKATLGAVEQYAPGVNVVLIPNCVNMAKLPKPQDGSGEEKTALFVGWVVATKGIGELVEAWAKVNPAGWKLEIVGPVDSDYREQLLARFHPEHIEFVGELPHAQAMERMAKCDLFVLPSYTEGFPNAVVEAMALGRAIVATDVGAIPEMLDGDAGVLVRSRDAQALAKALDTVIGDATLRERIRTQALEKAKRQYTIDVVFDAYIELWGRLSAAIKK